MSDALDVRRAAPEISHHGTSKQLHYGCDAWANMGTVDHYFTDIRTEATTTRL